MMPKNVPVDAGKYLTATTTSQTWTYQINLYETDIPVNINSQDASKGTLIAAVEGTEYKDSASAEKAINGYIQADNSQNTVEFRPRYKRYEGRCYGALLYSLERRALEH